MNHKKQKTLVIFGKCATIEIINNHDMKKKKPLPFKEYITNLCGELRREFFMNEWTIFYEFPEEKIEVGDGEVAAEIHICKTYLRFTLRIFPLMKDFYKKKNHDDIIDVLVHEFCHVLTEPLYLFGAEAVSKQTGPFLEETREVQTERISSIICAQLGKSFYDQFKIK